MAESNDEVYIFENENLNNKNWGSLSDAIDLTHEALVLFLANNFEGAKQKLEPGSKYRFYDALGYSTVNYLQAVITMESAQITEATTAAKNCLTICNKNRRKSTLGETLKLKNKNSSEFAKYTDEQCHAELCYAECLLQKAFLTFLQDENLVALIKGSLKIRECYRTYKECWSILKIKQFKGEKEKSSFESGTRLGVGAFNLLISMLPTRITKLLEFVGYRGSKKFGLSELNKAAQFENSLRQPMAQLMLLGYHCFVGVAVGPFPYTEHISEAKFHLDSCLKKYPKSAIFEMFRGRLELMNGNFDKAIAGYESSIECQNEWKNLHDICYWELLWCYVLQSDWLLGMKYAERLSQHSKWSKALYLYQKAVFLIECYSDSSEEMNSETKEHLKRLFESIPKLTQRFAGKSLPAEKFAVKRSKRYFEQNETLILPGIELVFIWNGFKILGYAKPECEKMLEACDKKLISFKINNNERSAYYYDNLSLIMLLKSVSLRYIQRLDEAKTIMFELLKFEKKVKEDLYIFPYTHVELAQIYFQEQIYTEVKKHLDKAKSYKGYSLESRLHFRIHSLSAMLKTALSPHEQSSEDFESLSLQEDAVEIDNDGINNNNNNSNSDSFLDCKAELESESEEKEYFNSISDVDN